MYVQKSDYKGRISTNLLDLLINEDPTGIIEGASKVAENTIQSLAGVLYDVSGETSKTGNDRNFYLLGLAINIALYNIYQIADDEQIPEKIIKNYDDTINDLTKISVGKMSLNLPAKVVDTPVQADGDEVEKVSGMGLRRMGSQPKRTHNV